MERRGGIVNLVTSKSGSGIVLPPFSLAVRHPSLVSAQRTPHVAQPERISSISKIERFLAQLIFHLKQVEKESIPIAYFFDLFCRWFAQSMSRLDFNPQQD